MSRLITIHDINEAAQTLRLEIDEEHNRIIDVCGSLQVADQDTKHLYDAVTLLHEAAMEGRSRGSRI
jgi:hypothetical protein